MIMTVKFVRSPLCPLLLTSAPTINHPWARALVWRHSPPFVSPVSSGGPVMTWILEHAARTIICEYVRMSSVTCSSGQSVDL